MYEKILVSIIFGAIMGSTITILAIMFMMGARGPDTKIAQDADYEALKECLRRGKRREKFESYADFMRGRKK